MSRWAYLVGMLGVAASAGSYGGHGAGAKAVSDYLLGRILKFDQGFVHVFPLVHDAWQDVQFEGIVSDQGWKVSAKRQHGLTVWLRIECLTIGSPPDAKRLLRLQDPFAGRFPTWNLADVRPKGREYIVQMLPGQVLEGRAGPEDPVWASRHWGSRMTNVE